jgi:DNA repair exonuclease SbcCD ATPase subunit
MSVHVSVGPPSTYVERKELLQNDYRKIIKMKEEELRKLDEEAERIHKETETLETHRSAKLDEFSRWETAWAAHHNSKYTEEKKKNGAEIERITSHLSEYERKLADIEERKRRAQTILAGAVAANTEVARTAFTNVKE